MNQFRYVKPLLIVAGLGCSASAFAGEWTVVPETSTVAFIGAQQGTKFNGRFGTFTAHINLDAADPTKGSIVGTVKLDSVNTRDHDRDAALLDKDWFNVKEFPEAKFESQKIEKAADGAYQASASFAEGSDEAGGAQVHVRAERRRRAVRRHDPREPLRLQRRRRLERHELGIARRDRRRQARSEAVGALRVERDSECSPKKQRAVTRM